MSATLASHAAQRAEQSASLQKGIALSAGFHLTLAVLLFGVLGISRGVPPIVIELPPGGHNPTPPPPEGPPPGGTRVVVIDPAKPGEIRPIDEDRQVLDDTTLVAIAEPGGDVRLIDGGETGNGSPFTDGKGSLVEDPLPTPQDFVYFDIEPEVIRRIVPTYPDLARQAGIEGDVIVRVLIGKRGEVKAVEVERSSDLFDEAAVEAVRRWTFRPAIASGNPVAVWIRIPIAFRMK
jgi:protein TonB